MEQEHMEMILEDINGKFDLILEGQESLRTEMHGIRDELSEKIEMNSFKIDVLNQKIDTVASDLKATDARLNKKIDAVAADLKATDVRLSKKIDDVAVELKAHRVDTEVHRGYRVRED